MRSLIGLRSPRGRTICSIFIALAICAPIYMWSPVLADPRAAIGYSVEVIRKPGAIFAGLARDGNALLVTDLSDGRLYRRRADGQFLAFGPTLPHGIDVIGDYITEINVTSPTGIREVKRFGGADIAALIWDAIEKRMLG